MKDKYYIPDIEYYVYRHIRNDTKEPFYIGIGKKQIRTKTCT